MSEIALLVFVLWLTFLVIRKDGALISAKHAANLSSSCPDDDLVKEIIRLRNAEEVAGTDQKSG